jgi:Domain of unknown function (DUF6908)
MKKCSEKKLSRYGKLLIQMTHSPRQLEVWQENDVVLAILQIADNVTGDDIFTWYRVPVAGILSEREVMERRTMKNPLLELITQLVDAAGETEAFKTEEEFSLQLVQSPFDPLEIRSWQAQDSYFGETRQMSLRHQCSSREDLQGEFYDPEIMLTEHGIPIGFYHATKVIPIVVIQGSGNVLVYTKARQMAEQFMEEWAQNLITQGWLSVAKAYGEVHKIVKQEDCSI